MAVKDKGKVKSLRMALVIVVIFMIIEFVFAWIANSLALMTDALHMFTDAGAILVSLFAFWLSNKTPTKRYTYGYHRSEILGALFSAFSTWALAIFLVYEAITRLMNPEPVDGPMVFGIAIVAMIANLLIIYILHKDQKESLNVKGAYIHVLGDLIGSVGVMIGGILMWTTGWNIIDPIITLIFSVLVFFSAYSLVKQTMIVLMQGVPENLSVDEIRKGVLALPGVESVHDFHVWSVTSGKSVCTLHAVTGSKRDLRKEIQDYLEKEWKIGHCTIQIENL